MSFLAYPIRKSICIDVQVLAGTRGGGRTPTYLTTDGAPSSDVPSVREDKNSEMTESRPPSFVALAFTMYHSP
jgi:hypothetical protein